MNQSPYVVLMTIVTLIMVVMGTVFVAHNDVYKAIAAFCYAGTNAALIALRRRREQR